MSETNETDAGKTPPEVRELRERLATFQCCGVWIKPGKVCSCGTGGETKPARVAP